MAHTAPVLSDHVVIGVDTHKHIHVAAVMDSLGRLLDTLTIPTDTSGFTQLLTWAQKHGKIMSFVLREQANTGLA